MRNLDELRAEIDGIDRQILPLFCRRMSVAAEVAAYKKAHGIPVLNAGREEEILQRIAEEAGPEFAGFGKELYRKIFALSRDYQTELNRTGEGNDSRK